MPSRSPSLEQSLRASSPDITEHVTQAHVSKNSSQSPNSESKRRPESSIEELSGSRTPNKAASTMNSTSSGPRPSQGIPMTQTMSKMQRFQLYETSTRFFLIGIDVMDNYRILKIDRTVESGDLSITKDDIVYTKMEMYHLLNVIDEGNKASGGIKLKCSTFGLLGFMRFTGDYYMLLITKRCQVAMIGGHYIYQIDGTELVSLTPTSSNRFKLNQNPEEARYVSTLGNLDLSRSFYFSYSYDITHTLQYNLVRERSVQKRFSHDHSSDSLYNEMFVWNRHLLEPAATALRVTYDWCIPIVHGFVDQATLSVYGRMIYITIIARRSRFFAGARFLKRGANDLGYVANDVETEQIVSEMVTTSFHAPGGKLFANHNYTSYVQHRGSIPLYWTQDSTGVNPKPDIELNLPDPFYSAAALHFDNLFERYGAPIYILNLVKARERTPRESKLLKEFGNAIQYLNQFLPDDRKIVYRAWDMSRASKSRDQDVIQTLESIAEDVLQATDFFHNGDSKTNVVKMQNGVARTNCIDCLDRTNAAQFVIGKLALGYQLHALGVISGTSIDYDTDAVNLYTHMYHAHGDTIAIQYGGSHLVNTMETYRKINQWTSHSRDMVESFKRYYHNSFLDGQRQEAYNLFLGNYMHSSGQPMLWDLSTDYYLHHTDPRKWLMRSRKNYITWFTPEHLAKREMPPAPKQSKRMSDDYWLEYYRPLALSSLSKILSYRMTSKLQHVPPKPAQESRFDASPFRVRMGNEQDQDEKYRNRQGVALLDPSDLQSEPPDSRDGESESIKDDRFPRLLPLTLSRSGNQPMHDTDKGAYLSMLEIARPPLETLIEGKTPKDSSAAAQWTLNQQITNSLNPGVTDAEMNEYGRYISHPLNLPLVISSDAPLTAQLEFLTYTNSVSLSSFHEIHRSEEDIADYNEFLNVSDNPLLVTEADLPKKRYKAYRQWLKGKSLFKQQRLDP